MVPEFCAAICGLSHLRHPRGRNKQELCSNQRKHEDLLKLIGYKDDTSVSSN